MPNLGRRLTASGANVRLDPRHTAGVSSPPPPALAVRIGLVLLGAAVALGVFRSGSIEPREWNYSLLAIGLLSTAYWSFHRPEGTHGGSLRQFAALALPAYVALQLVPLPAALVQLVSPGQRAIVDALRSIGVSSPLTSVSVNPDITAGFLFRIIGYLLLFLLAREFSSRTLQSSSPWLSVAPLIAIGLAEAGWGLTQHLTGGEAHGSYANKNHFAGLLEMVLPLAAARALYLCSSEDAGNESRLLRWIETCCLSATCLVLFAALLDSESKMGLIAGVAALGAIGVLWTLSRLRAWHRWLALASIALLCLFGLIFLPSDELVTRFGNVLTSSQNAGEGRWPIWLDTVNLIKAFPVFGCGLGNYQTAFLRFQTSVIDNTFAFAHNDYLQLTAELGIAGLLILAAGFVPLAVRPFRVALRYSRPQVRHVALGCAGAIAAMELHSFADFNLYIPANGAVLVWILGIAASLTLGPRRVDSHSQHSPFTFRYSLIGLSLLLLIYSSAWFVVHRGDAAAVTTGMPPAALRTLLIRDPASPYLWADLGESLDRSGLDATRSFRNAVEFGPFLTPVLLRAAAFYANHDQTAEAIDLTSRIFKKTNAYDDTIFNWYDLHHLPLRSVRERALAGNEHASRDYFSYLLRAGNLSGAADTWKWLLANSYATESLAHDYVNVLSGQRDYEEAARAWAAFLGDRREGYLESNWIYNGGFEAEPSGALFDWEIQQREDVTTALDRQVFHSGRQSLRLTFDGKQNLDYQQVREVAFVPPGMYRFEGYVRSSGITTDEGIAFRIFDPEDPSRLTVLTESATGTHDWTELTCNIAVRSPTNILEIRVIRKPSLRFDSNISGTAWIDSVRLSKDGL